MTTVASGSGVASELAAEFERNARGLLRSRLWALFRDNVFRFEDGESQCRLFEAQGKRLCEIDFLAHLRVDQQLRILDAPSDSRFEIVHGSLQSCVEKLKKSQVPGATGGEFSPEQTAERATHYIVCESKISGKKSIPSRFEQLEAHLCFLLTRKGLDVNGDNALSVFALAGLCVPTNMKSAAENIGNFLNSNATTHPLSYAMMKEERLFVFRSDTISDRTRGLEQQVQELQVAVQTVQEQNHLLQSTVQTVQEQNHQLQQQIAQVLLLLGAQGGRGGGVAARGGTGEIEDTE
eukprot:CAMPEP_0196722556 /NCGR_PEP_ID=MMETSP1091-20130531/4906_1 /TAXON_ID=302021 /ORGANISM="Rhodomonas sp., Strain CCMP768" /LENGTH=292 /DNA_ID=CAMNT_0042064297 /DNA_START=86 /DNA_END=964 /DNA_ORIENTATION=-